MVKDFLHALAHLCNDYHSGQWSKGYRLLSLSMLYLERWFGMSRPIDAPLTSRGRMIYGILKLKHEREL